MSECKEMAKLQEEDINHETIMKPEFYDIPEELQDRMTYEEGKTYETQEEKDWQKDHTRRFYDHLTTCKHPDCKQTLQNHIDAGFLKVNKNGSYTQIEEG